MQQFLERSRTLTTIRNADALGAPSPEDPRLVKVLQIFWGTPNMSGVVHRRWSAIGALPTLVGTVNGELSKVSSCSFDGLTSLDHTDVIPLQFSKSWGERVENLSFTLIERSYSYNAALAADNLEPISDCDTLNSGPAFRLGI
ncbi:hypothetical protein EVG20_g653 [Dentipellis fragilis]|uniref:Uncharacterized protein n=1 Tax=Dentipellis fragilis TaxID=205917 RepID=A0A4Y9ZBY9_9AGAM|nr:hypothetical protein EVG20_g653 [Dentipellis fragilis]